MGYASDTLDNKRRAAIELEHLREFYMYWAQFHAVCGNAESTEQDKRAASQVMVDKSQQLRAFYA